jgi:hypothetical protein
MRFCRLVSNFLRTAALVAATLPASAGEASLEPPHSMHEPPAIQRSSDLPLTTLVIAMLVAYQLRRKHRFLRPRPFSH